MNVGTLIAVGLTFVVSLAVAAAFWLGARLARHLVDQLWDAFKEGKL